MMSGFSKEKEENLVNAISTRLTQRLSWDTIFCDLQLRSN